jgi:hypothetical protein
MRTSAWRSRRALREAPGTLNQPRLGESRSGGLVPGAGYERSLTARRCPRSRLGFALGAGIAPKWALRVSVSTSADVLQLPLQRFTSLASLPSWASMLAMRASRSLMRALPDAEVGRGAVEAMFASEPARSELTLS